MGTLTTQADGKTSTNALGQIHNEVRHDLLASDAKQLAATLTRQLIAPLLYLNKGITDPNNIPYFEFDTRQPEDMKLYVEALPELVQLGMKIPLEWAHEKLAIPQAADDQDMLAMRGAHPELRQAQASRYRQVALSRQGEIIYPDQLALDDGIAGYLKNTDLSALLEPLIKQLGQAIAEGGSYEEAAERLLAAYPQLDTAQLQEALGRVLFVADLWGQIGGR